MRLRYTADALVHLEAIHDYLLPLNPTVARRMAVEIHAAAERLREFPHIGRKGEVEGTHEWVV